MPRHELILCFPILKYRFTTSYEPIFSNVVPCAAIWRYFKGKRWCINMHAIIIFHLCARCNFYSVVKQIISLCSSSIFNATLSRKAVFLFGELIIWSLQVRNGRTFWMWICARCCKTELFQTRWQGRIRSRTTLENYLSQFEGPHYDKFVVEEKKRFEKRSKVLSLHFKKWKTKEKKQYTEHFSKQNWNSLPELQKKQHQRANCQGSAVHHYAFQSLFPSWGNNNSLPLQVVINKMQDHVLKPSTAVNVKPTLKAIKQAVNKIYNGIKFVRLLTQWIMISFFIKCKLAAFTEIC